jgi:hypothetical protein
MKLTDELEKTNIIAGVSDDMYLMARLAGMDTREFRDENRAWFYCGDWELFEEMVRNINRNVPSTSIMASQDYTLERRALWPRIPAEEHPSRAWFPSSSESGETW